MQPLGVQDQGPVSQKIPSPGSIMSVKQFRYSRILKLGKFEIFSVNVTEKLSGYSKFPEEVNFIGQKCLERAMCILRPFRVGRKALAMFCVK